MGKIRKRISNLVGNAEEKILLERNTSVQLDNITLPSIKYALTF
jgi:hypothetical protein